MRALGTTLSVMAVLAVPSGFASAAPAELAQIPPVVADTVPDVTVEPPELPVTPPPLPEVGIPDVTLPTPVPTSEPSPTPAPPDAPASAGRAQPAESGSTPIAGGTRPPAPASGRERVTPRRAASRPARRPADGDRGSAASAGARSGGTGRVEPADASRPGDARPTAPRAPDGPPSFASRVADNVGELVRALPPAILWALVGVAALALGLAGNAFWQSRQRAALEAQRAELLDDIGLLSSALLPPMPEGLAGVAVSAAYRPADGPAAGGDFYDVFTMDEQRIGVLLGDVSGHGRESVTQAALARYTLRTLLAAGHPPGEALARADGLLGREIAPNFVTVIAGVYDCGTDELTYAKAGHAPPIVLGAVHDPDAEQPATPIGLGLCDAWPEYCVQMGEGVSVCLFTDGLEDARVGDARVGRGEVERLLTAQEVPDAGRLLGELEELADVMCDDAAAVVLSHSRRPMANDVTEERTSASVSGG
jgi:hypothetical protein